MVVEIPVWLYFIMNVFLAYGISGLLVSTWEIWRNHKALKELRRSAARAEEKLDQLDEKYPRDGESLKIKFKRIS